MCVAIPGKVIKVLGEEAIIGFGNITKQVNIMLIEGVKVDDYLIIHGGCAINKISKEEGEETIRIFRELIDEVDTEFKL